VKQGLVDEQSIQDQSRVIEFKKNIEIEIENKSASRRNGVAPVHSYLYLLKKNPGVKSGPKMYETKVSTLS
jgi:hypothetical protein